MKSLEEFAGDHVWRLWDDYTMSDKTHDERDQEPPPEIFWKMTPLTWIRIAAASSRPWLTLYGHQIIRATRYFLKQRVPDGERYELARRMREDAASVLDERCWFHVLLLDLLSNLDKPFSDQHRYL